jgi:hypothetical protein
MSGKEVDDRQSEAGAEVFDPSVQPLYPLRSPARVLSSIWVVPGLPAGTREQR